MKTKERTKRWSDKNPEKIKEYARENYWRVKSDPERLVQREIVRAKWYAENRELLRQKQKLKKRERKLEAIIYLGGKCFKCDQVFHPAVFEFHHRNPDEKDCDPSKVLNRSKEKMLAELDKCDLLCANCHRLTHHTWEETYGV
jgi:hypothetical protein